MYLLSRALWGGGGFCVLIAVLPCARCRVSLAVLVNPSRLGTWVSHVEADAALAQTMLFWAGRHRASHSWVWGWWITDTTPQNELEPGAYQAFITGSGKQTCLVQLQSVAFTACHLTPGMVRGRPLHSLQGRDSCSCKLLRLCPRIKEGLCCRVSLVTVWIVVTISAVLLYERQITEDLWCRAVQKLGFWIWPGGRQHFFFLSICSDHNQSVHCVFLERTYQQKLTT